jgi:hypothetical protein
MVAAEGEGEEERFRGGGRAKEGRRRRERAKKGEKLWGNERNRGEKEGEMEGKGDESIVMRADLCSKMDEMTKIIKYRSLHS